MSSPITPTGLWQDGWLSTALHRPSPNADLRPEGCRPDLLVVHSISLPAGQYWVPGAPDYISQLFLNELDCQAQPEFASLAGVRVSSHFLIRRDGQLIQFVSVVARAWHAGLSQFMGRQRCNDFSVGVELEGCDHHPFELSQYQTLATLTEALSGTIPLRHIAGHQHIAPGRKSDPGPFFDWLLYQKILADDFPLVLANAAIHSAAVP